jgi:CheY-like chemotaxis protein
MTPETDNAILIVEDEAASREALSEFLASKGYDVACASNGLAALYEVTNKKPKLILLDLMMPVMDGYAFLELARKLHLLEGVAVIVTTAQQSANMPGAAATVDKPIRPERLMPLVRRFVDAA